MVGILCVCTGLLAASPAPPPALNPTDPRALETYQVARQQAGRDPTAQVRLALWCEAHGLTAERLKHLPLALLADPEHPAARGLLGRVRFGGRWARPDEVGDRLRADARLAAALAEYNAKRARTPQTAEAQWKLALWCEKNGLDPEATAHLTVVTRLDPGRDAAWKKLGYTKDHGRWTTEAERARERAERAVQARADRHWGPLLERWQGWLRSKEHRAEAERLLSGVTDPLAVPSVYRVFGAGGPADRLRAVQVLGQIDAPGSSRALAVLAAFDPSQRVRRTAAETLFYRDPRESARVLIDCMRDPIRYEVKPVGGPGIPGAILVEGKRFNVQRIFAPPPRPRVEILPGDFLSYDPSDGLPVIVRTVRTDLGFGAEHPPLISQLFNALNQRFQERDLYGERVARYNLMARYPLLSYVVHKRIVELNGSPSKCSPEERAMLIESGVVRSDFDNEMDALIAFQLGHSDPVEMRIRRVIMAGPLLVLQIPIGRMELEARKASVSAQQQLESEAKLIDGINAVNRGLNEWITRILNRSTGEDLEPTRAAWETWWQDQLGYRAVKAPERPRPTVVQNVPLAYRSPPLTFDRMIRSHICFAAGTPVHTMSGLRPIEEVAVGDRVLAQDPATGALSYQPVVATLRNPPVQVLRVRIGEEEIVTSVYHRFWRAGKGWATARDLKPGDTLRTLDGLARVEAVESGKEQPVYNLEVAETGSFFVGRRGTLVHDNTVPRPVLEPFDAPPDLAKLIGPGD